MLRRCHFAGIANCEKIADSVAICKFFVEVAHCPGSIIILTDQLAFLIYPYLKKQFDFNNQGEQMTIEGQVAVVTGGSRGIGKAISLALAGAGAHVAINYRRDTASAKETAAAVEALGRKALIVPGDVSLWAVAQDLMKQAFQAFGRIDILVNNAGIASRGLPVEKTQPEEWNRVLTTNLYSVFNCSKAVLEYMYRAQKGNIINISSIASHTLTPGSSPYATAKAGVDAFTKVLAREEGPHGIRVNAIAPGIVKTDMGERLMKAYGEEKLKARLAGTPLGRIAYPEELGDLAVFLVSEKASYITGKIFHMDGGLL